MYSYFKILHYRGADQRISYGSINLPTEYPQHFLITAFYIVQKKVLSTQHDYCFYFFSYGIKPLNRFFHDVKNIFF